ncbi:HTH-type transcriptional regulator LutR [Rubripirellula tenax]|uniref:HTH-type transcriptional regulator LutR n=1 Tax=Rubripirellula tenax TaxID=2528015 RepID=A0A5C6F512_9BACT|nr:FadR/GntR family transcriptional regulator [Rubripirellula tenax]TWU54541.1 HTH-type transcriptional regulator LutR [Rubripirellula tenax]
METPKVPTKRNLYGQVLDDLGCRIMAGEVQPGDPLPQESTLCDQLGVSRTVVREAIKSLAAKGLVESRAKRGTIVCPRGSWNYLDSDVLGWQATAHVDGRHLFHLMELRRTVEPAAARIAAERATDEKRRLITEAYEAMVETAEDVDHFLASDIRFHVEILHATENPFFSPIANVISTSLESSLRLTNRQPDQNRTSLPAHQKVMNAICAGKPARAEAAMRSLLHEAADRIDVALS